MNLGTSASEKKPIFLKGKFKDGGLLSEAYARRKPTTYAVCEKCRTAFLDDVPRFGSLICPNGCGGNDLSPFGYALFRGATKKKHQELDHA